MAIRRYRNRRDRRRLAMTSQVQTPPSYIEYTITNNTNNRVTVEFSQPVVIDEDAIPYVGAFDQTTGLATNAPSSMDQNTPTEVVINFAPNLPNGDYWLIFGSGPQRIRGTNGAYIVSNPVGFEVS